MGHRAWTRHCLAGEGETLGMVYEHRDDAGLVDDLYGWYCARAIGRRGIGIAGIMMCVKGAMAD